MQNQHLSMRIAVRITKPNRDTLQVQADEEGHNNISRVVRELIAGYCCAVREGRHDKKGRRR